MSVNIRIRNGLAPNAGNGGATEGDLRGDTADIISSTSGVVDLTGGQLLVHEATVPAMTVVVDAGVGYIPNNSFDELDSDSVKFWEAVVAGTAGSRTLSIGANASGSTRIDLICIELDPGTVPDEFASNIGTLVVVAGTAGAGVPATPNYHLKLAEVTVINGATEIEDADITDSRTQIKFNSNFLPTGSATNDNVLTFTNKRNVKRVYSVASSATPTVNSDDYDCVSITALATAITSMTTNLTGTPNNFDVLIYRIKDDGTARTISWGSKFEARGSDLPTTTVISKVLTVGFLYDTVSAKWGCVMNQQEA